MKYFGWIFLFFIMVYIFPLGSRPMLNPYEFSNAELTREMVISGNLTAPARETLNNVEKLPMHRWMIGASFRLFGENSFANRLPSALAVGLTALFTALLIQQSLRDEKVAALAAMVYMSCALIYLSGTTAGGANVFTMFTAGAQGLLFLAAQENKFNRRKMLLLALAGIFAGAGFLAGGFAALVIPGISIILYLLCTRRWKEFLILPLPVLLFAVLTVLPWGMAMNRMNAGFWYDMICTERLSGVFSCGDIPWWIAPVLIAVGMFPASLFIPAALCPGKDAWKKILKTDVFRFSICAFITTLLYFSVLGKHPAGILLCFPPAAILTAAGLQAYFNAGGHHRAYNWVMSVWGIILLLTGIAGITVWFLQDRIIWCNGGVFSRTMLITGGSAAFFCGALMLYSLRGTWRSRMYLFFFGLALLPLGVSWCIIPRFPLMPEGEIKQLVAAKTIIPEQTIVVADPEFRDAAAWCLKNPTVHTPEKVLEVINDPQRQMPVLCIVNCETAKLLSGENIACTDEKRNVFYFPVKNR